MKRLIPILIATLGLAACQTQAPRQATAVKPEQVVPKIKPLPFAEPDTVHTELDEDLVFSYLVGEIGARAGKLDAALSHYLHVAVLARDPYAAERATRIALHIKDYDRGMRAARRWVELAPNALAARQLSAVMFLRSGEPAQALEQLRALLKIAEARGGDGMLQVAATLSAEKRLRAEVLQLMRTLVEEHPDNARAHYGMAVLETSQERYPEAEASLRKVIALKPDWAQPRVLLSKVLTSLGRQDQALEHLAEAVKLYPDSRLLRISYARLLVSANRFEAALGQFRALHDRGELDDEVRYGYAMLATQQSQWKEARKQWQFLRGEARFRDEASYFLGQVEEADGHRDLAIGLYRSVTSGEYKVDAVIRTVNLLADSGRIAQAREALAQARVANPSRAVDLYVAETQLMQKAGASSGEILALYKTAIEAHPEDDDLRYNRGLYFSEIGDYPAMEADFKAVLARSPDHAESLNALGYTLADRGVRLQEALVYISRALKLRPGNSAVLDSMGWVNYKLGRFPEALQYLREAAANDKDHEIAAHLIEVLWMSGAREEARGLWKAAAAHSPESALLRDVHERLLDQ